ncbi:aldo/keto reductase [Egicoccus halophilus]|uniref:Aldo/keto reductase n=1 Tax=Egicoccus halophilus TaxID=1670830 RepID=A0A8J3AAY0_9ACTN|nr:aldo/keto reductase [Egicoccus halophilus]GGI02398.1 aldo/keto reductase [Egicoccus halophilus]
MPTIGRSGVVVSSVIFGCGDNAGLMVAGDEQQQTQVIAQAIEAGITTFDTAAKYGDGASEEALGRVLHKLRPADVTVASKVSVQADAADPGGVLRACEQSLRRLGRDHIDLYQVHNRIAPSGVRIALDGRLPTLALDDFSMPGGVGDQLRELRDSGKVRAIGVTTYGGASAEIRRVIDLGLLDAINASFHLLNPTVARAGGPDWDAYDYEGVGAFAQTRGLAVLGIRPLAGGYLSARSGDGTSPPPGARVPDNDVQWTPAVTALLDDWCGSKGCRIPELATAFSLAAETITSPVIGISEVAHVSAVAGELAKNRLTTHDVEAWMEALLSTARAGQEKPTTSEGSSGPMDCLR